ncbi:Sec1-like family protein [Planoprotostelium fungivorum]|uniref:Sec1-like family protein n=1 Tax=Planoprotostelium fungivorum TaxID=1890364 RepID=A0A2P6N6G5_9EUKA|nr:Sec1-like family protein [Planoprotostelium fungivorum]PRP81561.1 Sec1-like family protein [Planoprotostelium fungivorum]
MSSDGGFNLREATKARLIQDMIKSVNTPNGLKVLVLNAESTKIISAACRMFDIIEEGVTLVEPIYNSRQPLDKLEAIYFLTPTDESIEQFCKDFSNPSKPQYAAAHLFFTRPISNDQLAKIKASPALKYVKSLKEINLDFIGYEGAAFHLDMPQAFHNLFSPDSSHSADEQHLIADRIVTMCATLKEYPVIRYQAGKDGAAAGLSHNLARLVSDKLDRLMRGSEEFNNSVNPNTRSTLIIVDRSIDPIAPLLHEFTYQAMIHDLLPVDSDKFSYETTKNDGSTNTKQVLLSELDPLWETLRHMHIAETMNWIIDNFNSFVKDNKASKLTSGKKVSNLKEMSDAMKAMPQYKEMLDKYSLHINMSQQCMTVFNEKHLADIAGLEQDMATGEDSEGKPVKNIISGLPRLLTLPEAELPLDDKLRLLMLYIISQEGIKDADRKRLMELAHIPPVHQSAIANLRFLGVTLMKGTKAKKTQKMKEKKKSKQRTDAPPYELSRYVPALKVLGQEALENTLDTKDYPYLKEDAAAEKSASSAPNNYRTSTQPKWANKDKRKTTATSAGGNRLFLFVAGGATFSELRSVYELSEKFKREVIIGTTSLLSPTEFVENLRQLKRLDLVEGEL